jgi:hypothetical protein
MYSRQKGLYCGKKAADVVLKGAFIAQKAISGGPSAPSVPLKAVSMASGGELYH